MRARGYEEGEGLVLIAGMYSETVTEGTYEDVGRERMYATPCLRL